MTQPSPEVAIYLLIGLSYPVWVSVAFRLCRLWWKGLRWR